MPMKRAPHNSLGYGWAAGEDYWGGTMNDNILFLDTVLNLKIKSLVWASPPGDAVHGDSYIVAEGAADAWAGHPAELATLVDGTWVFYKPVKGWRAFLLATERFIYFDGVQWVDERSGDTATGGKPAPKAREYHISVSVPYQPTAREALLIQPMLRPCVLDQDAKGSQLSMLAACPFYVELAIYRNNFEIGKMIIHQGEYNATFSVSAPITFGVGDRMVVYAPVIEAEGFKNFGFVLKLLVLGGEE